ncbi:type IV pilus biogenesis/stability protein PilW [Elongatibacter sediminis]|uniref:Type IV pilus biogenesis/stability protein PilW n=1 Tax=Elongatibacter sediminis TaxID=3119006 RepID=A0AAW9R9U9_9GAMM
MTRTVTGLAAQSVRNFHYLACIVLLTTWLGGCASTGPSRASEDGAARKAAETNTSLGRRYMDRGQYEVALEKLKRAVAHDRTYAPAHTLLAILYETINMVEEAAEEYRLAVRYAPANGDVNNNYGVFLCGQGEGEKADAYFQTAVKDPFYATRYVAYANAGRCALELGDLDKAERYLRQSLEYDGKYAPALLPMAEVSYRKEAFLPARGFLQRYEAVGEPNAASLYLGYRVETALGDARAADAYLRTLRDEFPGSAEAAQTRAPN